MDTTIFGNYEMSDGALEDGASPIETFHKDQISQIECNKSSVKELIGKSLSYIIGIGIGASQKWSKSGNLHQKPHFIFSRDSF